MNAISDIQAGKGLTRALAEQARGLRWQDIPDTARVWARQCVLDYLGCGLAGASDELVGMLLAEMRENGGIEAATIVPAIAQDVAPTIAPSPSAAEAGAPRPHRAVGITTDLAVEAAMAANAACAAMPKNYRVTTLVTDANAVPIAMISYDNGAAVTQRIAMGKAQLVVKYKMRSTEAVAKAKTDTAFAAELAANPLIVAARPGGNPIMMDGQLVGTISVSGTPDGHDDDCAMAGLDKIKGRLKLIQ